MDVMGIMAQRIVEKYCCRPRSPHEIYLLGLFCLMILEVNFKQIKQSLTVLSPAYFEI